MAQVRPRKFSPVQLVPFAYGFDRRMKCAHITIEPGYRSFYKGRGRWTSGHWYRAWGEEGESRFPLGAGDNPFRLRDIILERIDRGG